MKFYYFIFIFSFFTFSTGTAATFQTDNFTFLEEQLPELDERDLVVFDMDEVLIVAKDALIQNEELFNEKLQGLVTKEESDLLSTIVWRDAKADLVDSNIPSLIKKLQKHGVKVIVLTASPAGRVGVIEDYTSFRIGELMEKGIHLGTSFPEVTYLVLEELDSGKGFPVFSQGVILAHQSQKGKVLAAFLNKIDWKPRRLIFTDDWLIYLQQVERDLSKLGIKEIQTWHFSGAKKHAKPISEQVVHLQIQTLIKQKIWLSDEEAEVLLCL